MAETEEKVEKRINLDGSFQCSPDYMMRKIGDESVLVPIGEGGQFENCVLSLNSTCSFLWEQFRTPNTVAAALEACKEKYEGDPQEIVQGVVGFVVEYLQAGLLVEAQQ